MKFLSPSDTQRLAVTSKWIYTHAQPRVHAASLRATRLSRQALDRAAWVVARKLSIAIRRRFIQEPQTQLVSVISRLTPNTFLEICNMHRHMQCFRLYLQPYEPLEHYGSGHRQQLNRLYCSIFNGHLEATVRVHVTHSVSGEPCTVGIKRVSYTRESHGIKNPVSRTVICQYIMRTALKIYRQHPVSLPPHIPCIPHE